MKNDIPLPPSRGKPKCLTDRQTDEAIRVVREQSQQKKPFFLNLWYDAPHSPWEPIEPFYSEYRSKFETERLRMYASMIANMDWNIGRFMAALTEHRVADNTLVFFTSDNGPEGEAGSTGR